MKLLLTNEVIGAAARAVIKNCDLERIKALAGSAVIAPPARPSSSHQSCDVSIGVAFDKAFCFYYPENLEALRVAGAKLEFFDTMHDQKLPDVDGFYIGGGFPESFLQELEDNTSIRTVLKEKIEQGTPVYAECGGLRYLARSIEINGGKKNMVGALQTDVCFQKKPVGHGYIHVEPQNGMGWLTSESYIAGHEFHYSKLTNIDPEIKYLYRVKKRCRNRSHP